ncbi:unnamed protein product [Parascedosporium putredinis]|uniref:SRP9 domain-containing protein n=1 Tax=Parascedosporium putredinis TaxID=1442378 RepID=A0A9P1H9Q8_9PEZI|nr:unnamed protein product [Parascedosporium putredinis]CAI8001100.1 unnamed protein product [Parascedosporium putredinis]
MPKIKPLATSQEWFDQSILLIEARPTTTFDPVSGVVLKYKTTKAAEVNRLIQVLGKLSKGMAGLQGARDDVLGTGATAADESEKPAAEGALPRPREDRRNAE